MTLDFAGGVDPPSLHLEQDPLRVTKIMYEWQNSKARKFLEMTLKGGSVLGQGHGPEG